MPVPTVWTKTKMWHPVIEFIESTYKEKTTEEALDLIVREVYKSISKTMLALVESEHLEAPTTLYDQGRQHMLLQLYRAYHNVSERTDLIDHR